MTWRVESARVPAQPGSSVLERTGSLSEDSKDKPLSRIEARIYRVLKGCHYGGMAFVVAMLFMTVVDASGRYSIDMPLKGSIELACFFLVVATMLVGAYTVMVKGHITIGVVVDRFSERTQAIFDIVAYLICSGFAVIAVWQTIIRADYLTVVRQGSGVLQIPFFPFYYLVAVGWGIFALATIMYLVFSIRKAVNR